MPALKGLHAEPLNPSNYSSFARTSWTQPEGSLAAHLYEARVFNVNMTNWTIDVNTIFDQRTFLDIQVASPYLNAAQGEGLYCVPEVGSKCLVCVPGDGAPPFVLAFLMPMTRIPVSASDEAPVGTAPRGGAPNGGSSDYTWAGGRRRGKPGDIIARTRDGNFMELHRGGVAQFGATALAQRICVPLGNLVTDISQNYNHFNSGGTINWGLQDRGNDHPRSEYRHTLRVYANDEFADLRFAMGHVRAPVPEPTGNAGEDSNNHQLGIGTEEDVVFELALARQGFETDSGDFKGKAADVYVRIFVDRKGNMMGRWEGNVNLRIKENLRLTVDKDIRVTSKKSMNVEAAEKLTLLGKKGAEIGTAGGALVLNGGGKPVASAGSTVRVTIVPGIVPVISAAGVPIGFVGPAILDGVIASGNPTILV